MGVGEKDPLVLLVDRAHQGSCWRKDIIHKDKDGLFRCELDTLSNDVYKLTDSEVLITISRALTSP